MNKLLRAFFSVCLLALLLALLLVARPPFANAAQLAVSATFAGDQALHHSSTPNGHPFANSGHSPDVNWSKSPSSLVQLAKLSATDETSSSWLGYSLAISGDGSTIVVGAYDASGATSGAAYVYAKPGGIWGNMSQTAKLTPAAGANGDRFGWAVSISDDGSTIVVGATQPDNVGAAYVFSRPTGGWTNMHETARLTPSDGDLYMSFGDAVAVSGDGNTVIVGANLANIASHMVQGAAYVFVRPLARWSNTTQAAKLTSSDGASLDWFGYSVAANGNGTTLVVGAAHANGGTGEAYVFAKPGGGWTGGTETARLTVSGAASGDFVGASAAVTSDGGTVVLGAPSPLGTGSSAYLYVRSGANWTSMIQTAKLTPSDGTAGDEFGSAVAISPDGSTSVIGAPYGSLSYGEGYVFDKPGGGWGNMTENNQIRVPLASSIGQSVGVSGGVMVIGANTTSGGGACVFGQGSELYLPLAIK